MMAAVVHTRVTKSEAGAADFRWASGGQLVQRLGQFRSRSQNADGEWWARPHQRRTHRSHQLADQEILRVETRTLQILTTTRGIGFRYAKQVVRITRERVVTATGKRALLHEPGSGETWATRLGL